MPEPEFETDEMNKSQNKQKRLPPELRFPGSNGSSLGHEARVGSVTREPGSRMALVVAVLTANKDYIGEVREYNGLLVYHNKDFATDPTDKPLLGWIVAETPQAVNRERFMALLTTKKD